MNKNDNLKKITGIWLKTAKSGKRFFYVNIGDKVYIAFENGYKIAGSSAPDFVLYEDLEAVSEEKSFQLDHTERFESLEDQVSRLKKERKA